MVKKAGKLQGFGAFKEAFKDAYGEGREEWARSYREGRKSLKKAEDAPRIQEMMGSYPTGVRTKELIDDISGRKLPPEVITKRVIREDLGLGPKKGVAARTGQLLGTAAADVTQDVSRNFYWLLNAAQATGNVVAETALAFANRNQKGTPKELYGRSPVIGPEGQKYNFKQGNRIPDKYVAKGGERILPRKGYSFDDDGTLFRRNFEPGDKAALLIPTGIAINTGLGLMSPFGGVEGFKAAVPSDEDPTKTENVVAEIASKYFLGRTGNLLPYDEFSKVRPDVSPGEYKAYQAFKYDNSMDLNPFDDGQVVAPAGILKYTNEGVLGPEVQFLGRSLPVTTAGIPFASALAGGMIGVRSDRPIKGGLVGGFGGLAVGQIAGNLIEQERRRRNTIENQMENPQY
nr:hypothetical protein 111 [Pelagibacteraceae bacterium]